MPICSTKSGYIYYEVSGNKSLPPLLLSNSLGTDHEMWNIQVSEWSKYFYVIQYDTRGHGQSGHPKGLYSIAQLGQDVIDLLDHLDVPSTHFCGLSMGGVIGQWLAIHQPHRINRLVLANTAPKVGTAQAWLDRANLVRQEGMGTIAASAHTRWFTTDFYQNHPERVKPLVESLKLTNAEGYAACCEALAQADFLESIQTIQSKTLIIQGVSDPVTTLADGQVMQAKIKDSTLFEIQASHISNIEQPQVFTKVVLSFLTAP